MIVYKVTKEQFIKDVFEDKIEDIITTAVEAHLGMKVGKSEYQSWANSLPQVESILRDPDIQSMLELLLSIPYLAHKIVSILLLPVGIH